MAELPEWELGVLWTLALATENKTHAEGKFPTDPDDYFVLREGNVKSQEKKQGSQWLCRMGSWGFTVSEHHHQELTLEA